MVRLEAIEEHSVSINIDRAHRSHPQSEMIDSAWNNLCAQNPRYFNGSMLTFDSYDQSTRTILASVEEYKNHAVRDSIDVGISLLAVTAILTAPDAENKAGLFLLGKRSIETHRYGGLWELGPSGGIDVPRLRNTLKPKHIIAQVAREIKEEIGVHVSTRPRSFRAIVHDDEAGSSDIVIPIVLEKIPDLKSNWEYSETRWMTLDELFDWTQTSPQELIPTTVELARYLYESRS